MNFRDKASRWEKETWASRYSYTFTWLGRPIIQLPDDLLRLQEVIFKLQPDVIIETGIAHGGSLIFSASLCKLIGRGRVIGIDIEVRPHNRTAVEEHFLSPLITIIEGSSIDPSIVAKVRGLIGKDEKVLVILDSCHTYKHVLAELEAYSPMVSAESFIVATDGIMRDLVGQPRAGEDWEKNNPYEAARDFLKSHPEFAHEIPRWMFNESDGLSEADAPTYWPHAWLKRAGSSR